MVARGSRLVFLFAALIGSAGIAFAEGAPPRFTEAQEAAVASASVRNSSSTRRASTWRNRARLRSGRLIGS